MLVGAGTSRRQPRDDENTINSGQIGVLQSVLGASMCAIFVGLCVKQRIGWVSAGWYDT